MLEEVLAEDDRALIFTQFAEMGHLLVASDSRRTSAASEVLFLHGGTPARSATRWSSASRAGQAARRSSCSRSRPAAPGLNLTAANHVFHFDRWWNPAVEDQATDRAFRIGQTRNVQVHKFVCAGTLEERIDEMIERKQGTGGPASWAAGEAWLTELSDTDELARPVRACARIAVGERR